jgi:hypothetical protein
MLTVAHTAILARPKNILLGCEQRPIRLHDDTSATQPQPPHTHLSLKNQARPYVHTHSWHGYQSL